jgi:hypothetical protein
MALMAAIPAVASAQTVTNFTPAGGNRSGSPGSILRGTTSGTGNSFSISTTQSTVTVSGTVNSVEYYYTSSTLGRVDGACVNSGLGTGANRNVNPALPRTPGDYTIFFQAFSSNDCSGTGGPASGFNGGTVTVTKVEPNPAINPDRAFAINGHEPNGHRVTQPRGVRYGRRSEHGQQA